MKGLLRFDWISQRWSLLLMALPSLLVSVAGGATLLYTIGIFVPYFFAMPTVVLSILPVSSLLRSSRNTWLHTIGTMPVARRTLVHEKYLLSLCMTLLSAVLYLLLTLPGCLAIGACRAQCAGLLLLLAVGLWIPLLALPLFFRFGEEVVSRFYAAFFMGFAALMMGIGMFGEVQPKEAGGNSGLSLFLSIGIFLVTALLFAGSWKLSLHLHDQFDIH